MKIRRIRRGFTTNSSSAGEWVPGQPTPTPTPRSKGGDHNLGKSFVLKPSTTPQSGSSETPATPWSHVGMSSALLGGLALVVGGIILAEKLLSKNKGRKD